MFYIFLKHLVASALLLLKEHNSCEHQADFGQL